MTIAESLTYLRELNRALRLLILDERTCAYGNFELKYREKRDQVKGAIVYRLGDIVGSLLVGVPAGPQKNGRTKRGVEIVMQPPRISKADMHHIRAAVGAITRDATKPIQAELAELRARTARLAARNALRSKAARRARERIAAR